MLFVPFTKKKRIQKILVFYSNVFLNMAFFGSNKCATFFGVEIGKTEVTRLSAAQILIYKQKSGDGLKIQNSSRFIFLIHACIGRHGIKQLLILRLQGIPRKRHISASRNDNLILKKVPERSFKLILSVLN